MDAPAGDDKLVWELLDSHTDREYGLFSVRVNRNRSPSTGRVHEFQVLDSPEWVCVVPITPEGNVVMVRQYRHGSGEISLEPPGGVAKPGQTPEQSAREELEEETGYVAGRFTRVARLRPIPALFTNHLHVFLAEDCTPEGRFHPDETEDLETILIPMNEVEPAIRSGRIDNAIIVASLYAALDFVKNRG